MRTHIVAHMLRFPHETELTPRSADAQGVAAPRAKGCRVSKVVLPDSVTLDGVMQGPGRPDEDTRGGFAYGGWAVPGSDELIVAKMAERMGGDHAFLFGRRTYKELLASWNAQGGPFKDALNETGKYVASRSSTTRLEWPNSTLLHGDIPAAVAELKQASSGNLAIMGAAANTKGGVLNATYEPNREHSGSTP